jgi:hypothetical protein
VPAFLTAGGSRPASLGYVTSCACLHLRHVHSVTQLFSSLLVKTRYQARQMCSRVIAYDGVELAT